MVTASYAIMRPISLRRHYWLSFRRRPPPTTSGAIASPVAVHDTKPRAPAITEERFWAKGNLQICGVILPNRYQCAFFAVLCFSLSLPVFLLDESGQALWHGLITLGSISAFAAFCWIIGMILASTSTDCPKDKSDKK